MKSILKDREKIKTLAKRAKNANDKLRIITLRENKVDYLVPPWIRRKKNVRKS